MWKALVLLHSGIPGALDDAMGWPALCSEENTLRLFKWGIWAKMFKTKITTVLFFFFFAQAVKNVSF